MPFTETYYPETRFGGFTSVDGTVAFYSRVNALLRTSSVVLDVGCGRGEYAGDTVDFRRNLRILRGKCHQVIGLDVDVAGKSNPFLDEFRPLAGESWPVADTSVDLVICDQVVEHVQNPIAFFSECFRVLRGGGYLCVRTSNSNSYVGFVARMVPDRLHALVLGKAQKDRKAEDVFPTLYRCNTPSKLRHFLERWEFDCTVSTHESEPAYLWFSRFAYRLGVLHQRFAPRALKPCLFAFAQKRESGGTAAPS
jgi:SAM-dependent methyltransferase